jgi:hypothetical protein
MRMGDKTRFVDTQTKPANQQETVCNDVERVRNEIFAGLKPPRTMVVGRPGAPLAREERTALRMSRKDSLVCCYSSSCNILRVYLPGSVR